MPEAVIVDSVSMSREGRRVLDQVQMKALHGQVSIIVGPNGAGKSTLLKAIGGLLPYTGAITVEGQDVAALSPRQRAQLIAFVPQQTQLRAPMPVRDVVAQGRYARATARIALRADDVEAIEQAMNVASVLDLADRPFTELSGGEQRRVLVARALATGARVLLFDEPTASLDVRHALALYELVRKQADAGVAVVMVLHALGDVLRFADHVVLLHEGGLVASGSAADVVTERNVSAVYGVQLVPNAKPAFELMRATGRGNP
jgi:iron complex transport system ATP-binding protein